MKSILLHIHEDGELDSRLQCACDLARAFDAHVTCLHATPFEEYLRTDPLSAAWLPSEFSAKMRARRDALRANVEARLEDEGILWDWVHADTQISDALIAHSALVDLIVVGRRAVADVEEDEVPAIVGKVVTSARAPVFGVPPGLESYDPARPAVLAWNDSPEAAMAVRQGLSLLQRAGSVHIVTIESTLRAYPSDRAARYLARHGVEAEIVTRPRTGTVGESLLAAVREFSAGTLVMGGYGHSRLREFLLGGTTIEMLGSSPVPLLLGH